MLAEFGMVIATGIGHISARLPEILEDGENGLPGMMRELLQRLGENLKDMDRQVGELEHQIMLWHRQNEPSNGWGLRTLANDQSRFNPMSYHNGSVWPHDTALCAAGMAAYGYRQSAARLTSNLFGAAVHFEMRLPELYCGFVRSVGEPPVGYPVAGMSRHQHRRVKRRAAHRSARTA